MYKRIFVIVMDSLGVGASKDAGDYGDAGYNTLKSIITNYNDIKMPNLEKLGMRNLVEDSYCADVVKNSYYGKMEEVSVGKDTMTGHLEMMGLKTVKPLKTFTDTGFPKELLDEITKQTGREIIGNKSASGTEILDELGEEHIKTGAIIVYTSADSVLQIAANENYVPLEELYDICHKTRLITMDERWKVGRIIARPFVGEKAGEFKRTSNRHDYALKPFGKTVMDELKENGLDVIAVGKINDIFDTEGVTEAISTKSNFDGMEKTISLLDKDFNGFCFVNLVDFDALYGHRRDPIGYGKCIEEFDTQLKTFLDGLKDDDLLIITADHGNDPTAYGTDHTRELVPLIAYANKLENGQNLGTLESFASIGCTIAQNFELKMPLIGTSFLNKLK